MYTSSTNQPMAAQDDITALLHRFRAGDQEARGELIAAVYDELKVMAARYMRRERSGHTLQTTALVNEAYLRLVHFKSTDWRQIAFAFRKTLHMQVQVRSGESFAKYARA